MAKTVKQVKKAEPKIVKPKITKLELDETDVCQLRRVIDIATAGVCPADVKEVAKKILAKL